MEKQEQNKEHKSGINQVFIVDFEFLGGGGGGGGCTHHTEKKRTFNVYKMLNGKKNLDKEKMLQFLNLQITK